MNTYHTPVYSLAFSLARACIISDIITIAGTPTLSGMNLKNAYDTGVKVTYKYGARESVPYIPAKWDDIKSITYIYRAHRNERKCKNKMFLSKDNGHNTNTLLNSLRI